MRRWLVFAVIAVASVATVTALARRDAADSARCGELVAQQNRCCAEGQVQEGGVCRGRPTRCPAPLVATDTGCVATAERIVIAGGSLRVGAGDWEAEGRVHAYQTTVLPFAIDSMEITEAAYAACVDAGGCSEVRGSGEPGRARGEMTRAQAEAYCAFRGGRLPTADEWAFAAGGPSARRYPWGDTGAVCRRAAWGVADGPCAFGHPGPELAGIHPHGATPEGVHDMAGNVSEWVASPTDDPRGVVRGGSFSAQLATDLRTWKTVLRPANTRAPDVGARCAYDLPPALP